MIAPFEHLLLLGSALFVLGAVCAVTRRSVIMILVGVEIMLNAAGLVFIGGALRWGTLDGQATVLVVLGLAAAEVAFGLALLVHAKRQGGTVMADDYGTLKG
jgi:NADH-quinone oxidoreductase subunit K